MTLAMVSLKLQPALSKRIPQWAFFLQDDLTGKKKSI